MLIDHESKMENPISTSLAAGIYEMHGDQTFFHLVVEEQEPVEQE